MNRVHRAWRSVALGCTAIAAFLRGNLSVPVSAVVLAIAGAAALGVFDAPSAARGPEPTQGPRIALSYTPEPDDGPLVITYYLVDSQTAAEAPRKTTKPSQPEPPKSRSENSRSSASPSS